MTISDQGDSDLLNIAGAVEEHDEEVKESGKKSKKEKVSA